MLRTKDAGLALVVKNAGVTLDAKALGDDGSIEGYASVFNVVDSYGEAVLPGAFKVSLAQARRDKRRIKMLWQHDTHQPIGVWDEVSEDSHGLLMKGRLLKDASPKAAEAYGLIKGGALDEMSIGYREIDIKKDPKQPAVRFLKELDLREASIVTFGALGTVARVNAIKSILDGGALPTVREFEEYLRDAGFSKSLAAAIAGKAAPHLRGDPEAQANDVKAFLAALRA